MACCFSAYKQLFAEGQAFSYDLGRYYREGLDQWRNFADELQPLQEQLADVIQHYEGYI